MGKQDSNKVFPFMVWGLAAGFFMFHYVLRVAPAEMIPIFKTEFLMNMSKIQLATKPITTLALKANKIT